MRLLALIASVGLVGCVSFPSAHLVIDASLRESVAAPVVCGPMGFRKAPLQSRWGEYVRVTVGAPAGSVLRGTAFVHANGVSGEPRQWTTAEGNLVIEARFANLDPDARYALLRDRPIDVTLTNLEASGTCEGAVFTVEQGELVPNIDERLWIAELERRGGSELAERRRAQRLEMEARRQAHYAAWEARGATLVADVAVREAHYAAWEARRSPNLDEGTGEGENGTMASSGIAHSPTVVGAAGSVVAIGSVASNTISGGAIVGSTGCATCAVGATGGVASNTISGGAIVGSTGCTTCAVGATGGVASNTISGGPIVGSTGCATCAVGATVGVASNTISGGAIVGSTGCATCAVGGVASNTISGGAIVGSTGCATCAVEAGVANTTISGDSSFTTAASAPMLVEAPPSSIEWKAYPTPRSTEWTAFPAPPPTPALEPVAVSVETHAIAPLCDDRCQAANTLGFLIPAVFGVLLNVPAPPPPSRVVKAVPLESNH